MVEGPRRRQSGQRRVRRAVVSDSARLRGANVHASRKASRLNGTARQRNRGFNPLGTSRVRAPDKA